MRKSLKERNAEMTYKIRTKAAFALLLCISLIFSGSIGVFARDDKEYVILGGMTFGVSFYSGELKISGFDEIETEEGVCSPALDAGLLENDIILAVNGKSVKDAMDVTAEVKKAAGREMEFAILRSGEKKSIRVVPAKAKETGDYRLGVWLEDTTAGLGTVTYMDPESKKFGGLGHGILKGESGELMSVSRGVVCGVEIKEVNKGKAGAPGELCGDFLPEKIGVVTKNTQRGVFGVLTELPNGAEEKKIELGTRDDIQNGGASIFCTVEGDQVCEYAVEISCVDTGDDTNKNFVITVTDSALIEKTGGIVRGMSGSPVVQNGKLIGAVTHVLVNDPCKGYGIYIENMMEAAKQP
ncbi:MAG: SpoIVB peptidase [Ruminococcaceae bacterium]|nr:SpoIVB peptidase [Oscillospiraceae bacterium]